MTDKASQHIAIIGAGPGGLTLARLLHMQGYSPVVFEKETSPLERSQGGTLDLHPDSGLRAIHMAGLDEQFQAIARYEDQEFRILDKLGNVLLEEVEGAAEQGRPEVDRIELRSMLLSSLVLESVHWGCNLSAVRPSVDGRHTLLFENGLTETFDLVVGADGAWSRVRPLLSDARPVYTGVTYIELGIDDVDNRYPAIARLVGHGSLLVVSDTHSLVAQRNAHGYIRVYVALRISGEEHSASALDVTHPALAREQVLKMFVDWSPEFIELLNVCNEQIQLRPLYTLPVGHGWDTRPGVTLVGDAAHLMPPSAGQGVNMAMLDAVELAETIRKHSCLTDALHAYEQHMFIRAKRAAERSIEGLNRTFGSSSPESTVAYFRDFTNPLIENAAG